MSLLADLHIAPRTTKKIETTAFPWSFSDPPLSPTGAPRLVFPARIERPPFHRGGSASKKAT